MPVTLTLMTLAGVAFAAPVVAGHIVLSADRGSAPYTEMKHHAHRTAASLTQ